MKLLVVKTLHIRIDTTDDIEDHTNDDDQSRSRDEEVNITTRWEKVEGIIELGHNIWEYGNECQESTTPEIETIRNFLEK